jgi:hypothetical protein
VSLPAASVLRIDRGPSVLSAYRERASRLGPNDAAGWLALAFWAQERDLGTQAQEAFERVVRIDPENGAANAALGRVLSNGRYVTVEEGYRERGYVLFEGDWITPAEHEARLRAQAVEAQTAASREESQMRVREAEARAREAEAEARRAEAEAEASANGGIPLWGWGWGGWGGWSGPRPVHPPHLPPPTALIPPVRPTPPGWRSRKPRPEPEASPPPKPRPAPGPTGLVRNP